MVTATLEGAAVYEYLQKVAASARDEAGRLHADLRRLDSEMDDVVEHRGEALVALAQHYLPVISRDYILQTFAGVRDELMAVLARKARRLNEITAEIEQIEAARRRLEQRLATVTQQLNAMVRRRDDCEKAVAQQLAQHEEFQRLTQLALLSEQRLAQNEQRVEEIGREAAEKLPSYESSRLFQYLHQRKYGTPEYRHRGLTRRLDKWIAGLIDYGRARQSYEFLRVTPELMAQEVSRRNEEFAVHMKRLEDIERETADATGLTEVLREGERLGAERDDCVATLSREQDRASRLREEQTRLQRSHGEFYDEAIDRFSGFLETTEANMLQRRASVTPQAEDDRIVAEVNELNEALDSIKARIADLADQHKKAQERLRGAEYVVGRYRQMDYDSERSYFAPGFDPAEPMEKFFRGEINRRALWRAFSRQHRFRPTWLETTAAKSADVIESQAGQLLLYTLLNVAGPTMRDAARRGMNRRGGAGRPPHTPPPQAESPPPRPSRGFTSGRGF